MMKTELDSQGRNRNIFYLQCFRSFLSASTSFWLQIGFFIDYRNEHTFQMKFLASRCCSSRCNLDNYHPYAEQQHS
ncbi:CLUMA_CG021047, isoform A [Clunio marinus]|uniref:CLUMA_CG021047, isoform A n=1 Tax=Clunio marinus TaxID=568069 RepID=A0A1J1JA62_9DIPT|nr:CLUMA_CG021047, isoform A [Clunio marinus]